MSSKENSVPLSITANAAPTPGTAGITASFVQWNPPQVQPIVPADIPTQAILSSVTPVQADLHGDTHIDWKMVTFKDITLFVVAPDQQGQHSVHFSAKYTTYKWGDPTLTISVRLRNSANVVIHSHELQIHFDCHGEVQFYNVPFDAEWTYTPVIPGQIVTAEVAFAPVQWRHCMADAEGGP